MGHVERKLAGTPFLLLKCLITHYGRHCEPLSGKNALDCTILHISKFFRKVIPPDSLRNAPGAWNQTPISAWLVSVPTLPALRNDQWYLWQYVACMRLSTVGDRTFPVAAAQTRNSLPGDVIKFPTNLQNQTKISFILGVVSIVSKLL